MNNSDLLPPPPSKKFKRYRKFVGPSQFATITGDDEYQTAEQLKIEIENGYLPSDTYATCFGNEFESIAIYYYQKLNTVTVKKPSFVTDEKYPRIGGIADAIIDDDTGLEIKCHISEKNLLTKLPLKFLIQVTGYLYLYKKKKWILMSCIFNDDKTLKKYTIFDIYWKDVEERWNNEWYPKITQFINNVTWLT
jgi:hypothetical protein